MDRNTIETDSEATVGDDVLDGVEKARDTFLADVAEASRQYERDIEEGMDEDEALTRFQNHPDVQAAEAVFVERMSTLLGAEVGDHHGPSPAEVQQFVLDYLVEESGYHGTMQHEAAVAMAGLSFAAACSLKHGMSRDDFLEIASHAYDNVVALEAEVNGEDEAA